MDASLEQITTKWFTY